MTVDAPGVSDAIVWVTVETVVVSATVYVYEEFVTATRIGPAGVGGRPLPDVTVAEPVKFALAGVVEVAVHSSRGVPTVAVCEAIETVVTRLGK
jgi:hypothetical protein